MMTYGVPADKIAALVCGAVDQGGIPPVVYRYRAFDEHTDSSLTDGVQYFSVADAFNDPFDCQIKDSGDFSVTQLFEAVVAMGMPRLQATTVVLHNAKENIVPKIIEEAKKGAFNRRGILCLSERSESILMWSHYGMDHTGYALGFTVKHDPHFFASPFRVSYAENYPVYSHITEPQYVVEKGMLTKSIDWTYEREIRVIKDRVGLISFKKTALTEVILGARISIQNRDRMVKLLSVPEYDHVTIKQARVSDTAYRVEIDTVSFPKV